MRVLQNYVNLIDDRVQLIKIYEIDRGQEKSTDRSIDLYGKQ